MCKKKMCPFQHDEQQIIASEVDPNKSDNQEKENADTVNITNIISKQIDNADEANKEESNVDSDSESNDFECDLCGKIFVDENELAEHESSEDNFMNFI